jgi:hypothetical protein
MVELKFIWFVGLLGRCFFFIASFLKMSDIEPALRLILSSNSEQFDSLKVF